MTFSEQPWVSSLLPRLLLAAIIFVLDFQLVQSRPLDSDSGNGLHCPLIHLPQPTRWNSSLPSEFKAHGLLFGSEVEPPLLDKPSNKKLCVASGHGLEPRSPAVVKSMLTEYGGIPGSQDNISWMVEGASVVCVETGDHAAIPSRFLFSADHVRTLCLYKYVVLKISCRHANNNCYTLTTQVASNSTKTRGKVFRRDASSPFLQRRSSYQGSPDLNSGHTHSTSVRDISVGVVVCVVGVVVMIVLLAMCGGSSSDDKYEPSKAAKRNERSKSYEVADKPQEVDTITTPTEVASVSMDFNTNGSPPTSSSISADVSSRDKEITKSLESVDRQSTSSIQQERVRALSARSFDPLPDVPKLELGEVAGDNETDGSKSVDNNNGDDEDDAYAEVPREDVDKVSSTDSEEARGGRDSPMNKANSDDDSSPQPPPYGKISRHAKPGEVEVTDEDDGNNYAEVRDVMRRGPQISGRERALTEMVDQVDLPRDKRSMTESAAHLPLPRIPQGGRGVPPRIIDDNEMYDSISESQRGKEPSPRSTPVMKKKPKERLYETMEEMGDKDLYESVPEALVNVESPSSPVSINTPNISPVKAPLVPPLPPSSPLSSKADSQAKKKSLEKTLSASTSQDESKRRFSFFGRKKTASVSRPKKTEQLESPTTSHPTDSPLSTKSPPLPNIPVPPLPNEKNGGLDDDDEEDTYDRVTPNTAGHEFNEGFQQGYNNSNAASKTASLPMSYRIGGPGGGMGGGRPNLPLPKVPEDSGSGTVTVSHKRMTEDGRGSVDEYDVVHVPPTDAIPDEPSYDTVKPQEIPRLASTSTIEADPPYDKIDKQELMELREKERQSSPSSDTDPYSKVRLSSPDRGEPNDGGPLTEHNEEGYAVVPEEIRMRKRAMSASQGVRQDRSDLSPDSLAVGYHLITIQDMDPEPRSKSASLSPQRKPESGTGSRESIEDQYASINHAVKKDKSRQRELDLEETLRAQEELRRYEDSSPVPPPLPPALHLEDPDEYIGPPIPAQSERIHQMETEEMKLPQLDSADPPYARVKNKVFNPYAEVSRPYAEVDVDWVQNQAKSDSATDEAMGYDVVGTVGVRAKTVEKKEETMYDTIEDVKNPSSRPELPRLEAAGSAANDNLYDCLLPETPTEGKPDRNAPRSMV